MSVFTAEQLAAWTGGVWTARPAGPLAGFGIDTRALRPGQVFVALKTGRRDGHEFLGAARAAGAAAALVRVADPGTALPQLVVADPLAAFQAIAAAHRRAFTGPVAGVTGSAGKTSTKDLLALLLGGASRGLATEGNLNNHLGVPLTLTRLDPARHEFAVIEAGISAPGEMRPLADMIQPDLAIVTLVAPAHVQELGGLEGVAREKAELLRHRRPGGLALFPASCREFAAFRGLAGETLTVASVGSVPAEPGVVLFQTRSTAGATELELDGGRRFRLARVSRGMAQNAVLAILAAAELGRGDDAIQRTLAAWRPAAWRGELREKDGRLLYLDCYNSNPASLADALENFDALTAETPGARLFVIGGMEELGDRAADYHREAGRKLRLRADDFVFVTGDHAEAFCAGARASGAAAAQLEIVADLVPVRARLAGFPGAVFLKGSRRYRLETVLEPAGAEIPQPAGAPH